MMKDTKNALPEIGDPITSFADVKMTGEDHGFVIAELERQKPGMTLTGFQWSMRKQKIHPNDYKYSILVLLLQRHGGGILPLREPGNKKAKAIGPNGYNYSNAITTEEGLKKFGPGNEFNLINAGWVPPKDKTIIDGDVLKALQKLCTAVDLNPQGGLVQRSASGKLHIVCTLPEELQSDHGLSPTSAFEGIIPLLEVDGKSTTGIDLRGHKTGHIVVAPSHVEGTGHYEWIHDDEPMDLPPKLVDWYRQKAQAPEDNSKAASNKGDLYMFPALADSMLFGIDPGGLATTEWYTISCAYKSALSYNQEYLEHACDTWDRWCQLDKGRYERKSNMEQWNGICTDRSKMGGKFAAGQTLQDRAEEKGWTVGDYHDPENPSHVLWDDAKRHKTLQLIARQLASLNPAPVFRQGDVLCQPIIEEGTTSYGDLEVTTKVDHFRDIKLRQVVGQHMDFRVVGNVVETIITDSGRSRQKILHLKQAKVPVGVGGEMVQRSGGHPEIKPLKGIITVPILRLDGTVAVAQGYDKQTQLLVYLDSVMRKVAFKERYDSEDARRGAALLLTLTEEIPWKEDEDVPVEEVKLPEIGFDGEPTGAVKTYRVNLYQSAFLSMLMTELLRSTVALSPIFMVNANRWGVGKTLLAKLAGVIGKGVSPATTEWKTSTTEQNKELFSQAWSGATQVIFDNVNNQRVTSNKLCDYATTVTAKERVLGVHDNAEVQLTNITWKFTGFKIKMAKDLSLRTIPIELLDVTSVNPSERDFSHRGPMEDIEAFAKSHRGLLMEAVLAIASWHRSVEMTQTERELCDNLPKFRTGFFTQWSYAFRYPLVRLGLPDPYHGQKLAKAVESDANDDYTLLELVGLRFGDSAFTPGYLSEFIQQCGEEGQLYGNEDDKPKWELLETTRGNEEAQSTFEEVVSEKATMCVFQDIEGRGLTPKGEKQAQAKACRVWLDKMEDEPVVVELQGKQAVFTLAYVGERQKRRHYCIKRRAAK